MKRTVRITVEYVEQDYDGTDNYTVRIAEVDLSDCMFSGSYGIKTKEATDTLIERMFNESIYEAAEKKPCNATEGGQRDCEADG